MAEALSRRKFLGNTAVVLAAGGITTAQSLGASNTAMAASYGGHVEGTVLDRGGQVVNIRNPVYGAKGDGVIVLSGGSIVAGSDLFNGALPFAAADVGKVITIDGAGVSGAVLSTTITAVVAGSLVTLAKPADTAVVSARYTYGTDDTQAILAAVNAAGNAACLYAPPGNYMIRGASNNGKPIELAGNGGLIGASARTVDGNTNVSTRFLCGDASAGLIANGSATYQGFRIEGNGIAVSPMQNGKVVGGVAVPVSTNAKFIGIWVTSAAGVGWTILGAQDNTYYDIRCWNNAITGLYIDGGAGGLEFLHFQEWSGNTAYLYGVYADAKIPGGPGTYGDHTEHVRFWGGILDGFGPYGTARMYLRHATDWRAWGMHMVAETNVRVATVDLDQSSGYGIDLSGTSLYTGQSGQSPPRACVQVNGQPAHGTVPKTFVVTDNAWFYVGDSSVSFKGYGHHYSGAGWMRDEPSTAPRADAGLPAVDTLIRGRTGSWQTVTAPAPWSGNVSYRIDADGRVRLKGSVTASEQAAGPIINPLALGYRPAGTLVVPVSTSNGSATVTITSAGVVSASSVPSGTIVHLDGVTFVPDYPLP